MRLQHWILALCTTQLVLGKTSGINAEKPGVEELERKAIRYRLENIKQGYVRMHVIDEKPSPGKEIVFEITFDEGRVRQIRRYRDRGKKNWETEKIIVTPDKYIADHGERDRSLPVRIAPAANYKSPREHFGVVNIQALGMSANGAAMLHQAHVESLMNRSNRRALAVQADVHNGIDTWKIEYEIKHPVKDWTAKISLWIAPSQGYSVVGIYHEANQNGKQYSTNINTQMKQYPEKGVWYPKTLIKVQKAGDTILNRQEVIVEEARFGGRLDEAAFGPAGMKLKPGRKALDSTSGESWLKVWDGKEFVKPSGVRTAPANPVRKRRPRWLLLTLSAILGSISIIYFWRVIRQRRRASRPGT